MISEAGICLVLTPPRESPCCEFFLICPPNRFVPPSDFPSIATRAIGICPSHTAHSFAGLMSLYGFLLYPCFTQSPSVSSDPVLASLEALLVNAPRLPISRSCGDISSPWKAFRGDPPSRGFLLVRGPASFPAPRLTRVDAVRAGRRSFFRLHQKAACFLPGPVVCFNFCAASGIFVLTSTPPQRFAQKRY